MNVATSVCIVLTLALCGGYAGMVLMCQIGVLPGLGDLPPRSFGESWRTMDRHMERLMPPYKGALMLINLVTLVILGFEHRSAVALAFAASLILSIAGLVLTVRGQLPLNAELKSDEISLTRIIEIRERTIAGFRTRCVLAVLSFLSLCVGVVL